MITIHSNCIYATVCPLFVYFHFIFLQPFPPLSFCPLFAFIILDPTSTPALSLQGKVAQTACMSACKHLSTSLMQMLLDTELKQISMGAIQQFNLDVIQCERKLIRLHFDISANSQKDQTKMNRKGMYECDMIISSVCFSQCLPVRSQFQGFKETLSSWPLLICDR